MCFEMEWHILKSESRQKYVMIKHLNGGFHWLMIIRMFGEVVCFFGYSVYG